MTKFEWLSTRVLFSNSFYILLQVGQLAFELGDVEVLPNERKNSLSVRLETKFDQTDAIRVSQVLIKDLLESLLMQRKTVVVALVNNQYDVSLLLSELMQCNRYFVDGFWSML